MSPGSEKLTHMTLSLFPQLSVIDDDDDDVAGAILHALFNLPLDKTLSLPPPHHAANESRTYIDFCDIPDFHVRR